MRVVIGIAMAELDEGQTLAFIVRSITMPW